MNWKVLGPIVLAFLSFSSQENGVQTRFCVISSTLSPGRLLPYHTTPPLHLVNFINNLKDLLKANKFPVELTKAFDTVFIFFKTQWCARTYQFYFISSTLSLCRLLPYHTTPPLYFMNFINNLKDLLKANKFPTELTKAFDTVFIFFKIQ